MKKIWATTLAAMLIVGVIGSSHAQDASAAKTKRKLLGGDPLCFVMVGNRMFANGSPTNASTLPGLITKFHDGKNPHTYFGATEAWPGVPTPEKWADYLKPHFAKAAESKRPIVVVAQLPVEMLLGYRGREFVKNEADETNIKKGADALQDLCARLQKMGADTIVISDRGYGEKQPGSLQNWRAHDEFERRAMPGVWRGPKLHDLTSLKPHLFAGDGYHFSGTGVKALHYAWFARLCEIDGIAVPQWCQDELIRATNPPKK